MTRTWLPAGFEHPLRVEWTDGVHLRPISPDDVDIDLPVVLANRAMLRTMYGEAWGWPPQTMTREQDLEDLQHHADDMDTHASFNYAILPADEDTLLGCLYIDPVTTDEGIEAEVSWWLAADAPRRLRDGLDAFALSWLRSAWPFTRLHTPFNDVRPAADGNPDRGTDGAPDGH
ncbi:GNAT family N-acetyltransferase [Arthrobacter agilis]|uniref:GNAT family N-acetyltransferase n=1 Tax=Arthrobacter agilis TaxID=37921 RepID=UPI002787A801|nr:hypothetical protein [Arthrobacter agilis]MDQ0734068.1 hypothetical protein [Arthrobacter agilis]